MLVITERIAEERDKLKTFIENILHEKLETEKYLNNEANVRRCLKTWTPCILT